MAGILSPEAETMMAVTTTNRHIINLTHQLQRLSNTLAISGNLSENNLYVCFPEHAIQKKEEPVMLAKKVRLIR